jgi:GT2 family glycosyltransferase
MNDISVVIPSKNAANLIRCALAVIRQDPRCRIVVIDDGLDENPDLDQLYEHGVELFFGEHPFIFSRNVNIGIRAAGTDDVVILNDDAILQTPNGFSLMQQQAEEFPQVGLIGATTNQVGNKNQFRLSNEGLRIDPRMVCFIAVFVPRRTIDAVGLLDEDYNCYSHQDDDYCYRSRRAGLKIGISDSCFVDHASLPSTFRSPGGPGGELRSGEQIFVKKWGAYPL